jgi:cell wall assembly regulator SMI1
MIQIKGQNRQLEASDLKRIEDKMGRPLPEPYRAFLLAHNGGRPEPDTIDVPARHFNRTNVEVFHGLDDNVESNDLLWNLDALEGCLENNLLPIAADCGGSIFVLVMDNDDYGHVIYFESGVVPPRPHLLAKDFNEFLSLLRDDTPEEKAHIAAIEAQYYGRVYFKDPGRKLTDADIEQLETRIGRPLPEDYKGYLKAINGGSPLAEMLDLDNAPFNATEIKVLFSFEAEDPGRDLLHHWETIPDVKDWQWLPIGIDLGRGLLILDLRPEKYGEILYYDGDSDEEPYPVYWVAKGFDAFIDKLRDMTRADKGILDPIDAAVRFSGSRPRDALRGNAAAGFPTTPRGHVWHRHQDGETLQLVPKDVHKKTGDPKGYGLRWRSS